MFYKRVLTIAGSDSGGGAGIQADIKTISACGCFATSAITAVTVQNTLGVTDVHPVPVKIIEGQINSVLSDMGTDSIKIGMLHSRKVIMTVKSTLRQYKIQNIVLDPVMVSTSGHRLIKDEAIATLQDELFCEARVVTPNIPEAEILSGKKITRQQQLPALAVELSMKGKVSVLLKAGHLEEDELTDIFYNAETDEILELKSKRIYTKNTHGTGCTISSAIASFLALGLSLNQSVQSAKDYINQAIIGGSEYEIGHGHGPVMHFYKYWKGK